MRPMSTIEWHKAIEDDLVGPAWEHNGAPVWQAKMSTPSNQIVLLAMTVCVKKATQGTTTVQDVLRDHSDFGAKGSELLEDIISRILSALPHHCCARLDDVMTAIQENKESCRAFKKRLKWLSTQHAGCSKHSAKEGMLKALCVKGLIGGWHQSATKKKFEQVQESGKVTVCTHDSITKVSFVNCTLSELCKCLDQHLMSKSSTCWENNQLKNGKDPSKGGHGTARQAAVDTNRSQSTAPPTSHVQELDPSDPAHLIKLTAPASQVTLTQEQVHLFQHHCACARCMRGRSQQPRHFISQCTNCIRGINIEHDGAECAAGRMLAMATPTQTTRINPPGELAEPGMVAAAMEAMPLATPPATATTPMTQTAIHSHPNWRKRRAYPMLRARTCSVLHAKLLLLDSPHLALSWIPFTTG